MTGRGKSPPEQNFGPPQGMPEGPPTVYPSADYNFTLQMVGDLQKNVGGLIASVDSLSREIKGLDARIVEHGSKIDKINTKLAWAGGALATLSLIGAIVWALVQFIPWDRITIEPKKSASEVATPAHSPPTEK